MGRSSLVLLLLAALAAPAAAGSSCTCRANGQSYRQGEIACIRGKLSRCGMNQNVASWKLVSDTCPQAGLLKPPVAPEHGPQTPHKGKG